MINESSPIIKTKIQNELENKDNIINKSENIFIKNKIDKKISSLSKEEENKSIQVINPFDSITSKKIKMQSIPKNININNRYSQNSFNNNSISNSNNTYKQYNNFSYSLSTNKEKNINKSKINDSNDITFEINNNESTINNNYKSSYSSSNISYNNYNNNGNKKEEFKAIKESDEENYNEENNNYLGEIHLEDLELYVDKYYNNINDKKYNTKYEINKRISDIINKSPFENVNIVFKNKTNEMDIEKLIIINYIVYIKSIDNEQINQKFDEDFYSQILPAKNFLILIKIYILVYNLKVLLGVFLNYIHIMDRSNGNL